MSHIQSHHGGAEGGHDSFLVIFKVRGSSIHLWSRALTQMVDETHDFRISCQYVGFQDDYGMSSVQMLVLDGQQDTSKECRFRDQDTRGQALQPGDLITFITAPLMSGKKASFAIDLDLCRRDLVLGNPEDSTNRIGSCYLYMDPEFSTQGIQRTPILDANNNIPMGQIQVDYLVVTNPVAHGLPSPKPYWLFNETNLDAGHRGAGSGRRTDLPEKLLENTIDSFNYAHRSGADMCELDVLITADGIPIVYHDFDVDAATAHQSSNELGKLRVQVNQFTHQQLRDFRLLALHDGEGCPYTLNVPNQAEGNRPFPSLADVLDQVDATCGLNIEVKWPQLLENGKSEAKRFREINDFVDRIIQVVNGHAGGRRIVLESFDADLTILLRFKQNQFPVVFLTQGMTDRYERYADLRARSVWNGIYFAQAFDLAGIDLIADYYFNHGKELVAHIKAHNLVARAWGDMEGSRDRLDLLRSLGLQCITYDKVDLIKNLKPHRQQIEPNC